MPRGASLFHRWRWAPTTSRRGTATLRGLVRVDLGSGGASISIVLEKLTEIEHAVVSQSQSLTTHGSGSDVVLNGAALTRLPFDNSFTQMETQMPGAAQGPTASSTSMATTASSTI